MANRFGVAAADVAARLNNLLINDRSTPTIDTVEEMIEEATARVCAYVRAKGLPIPADGDGYTLLRSVVIRLSVYDAELARNRESTSYTDEVWSRCREMLDTLQNRPAYGVADPPRANQGGGGGGITRAACHRLSRAEWLLRRMRREGEL